MRRSRAALLASSAVLATAVVVPGAALAWAVVVSVRTQRRAVAYRPSGLQSPATPGGRAALVVFGAEALPTGPSGALRARLDHAIGLWKLGVAPVLVMTGGVARGIDEVDTMLDYAISQGVEAHALLPARPGQNTREQVASVTRVAAAGNLEPLIAVTSAYHAVRVEDEARRRGMRMRSSCPPVRLTGRDRWSLTVVDAAGVLWYRLPTKLTQHVNTRDGSVRHRLPHVLAGRQSLRALLPVARPARDATSP